MYIRYKTYKRKCPHCGYVYYKSDMVDNFQIGSPLRMCKKCQKDFIDANY